MSDESSTSAAVICQNLGRKYADSSWFSADRETVRALENVSLEVLAGEIVGVAGPSGSGKSTLLHLLAGLDTPTTGKVVVADTDLGGLSGRERTQFRLEHVGMVFQRFHLLPALTARENVALPLVERGVPRTRRRERALELLDRVELADRADHRPGELSGGEQQRVAVARSLVNDPAVVIADEPTGELDSETGERVLDLLTEVSQRRAVVLASHDDRALARADRMVRLLDGGRVDQGEESSMDNGDSRSTERQES